MPTVTFLIVLQAFAVDQDPIPQLIQQLASDDFEVREKATRMLMERKDALPAARGALTSPDPEVRRRARKIVEALTAKSAKSLIEAMQGYARKGELNLFIEKAVLARDHVKDDDLAPVWELVRKIKAKAKVEGGKNPEMILLRATGQNSVAAPAH